MPLTTETLGVALKVIARVEHEIRVALECGECSDESRPKMAQALVEIREAQEELEREWTKRRGWES